jgi:hypothetical protein
MPDKAKSIRCVIDGREFPWQSYVLPIDGRKARHCAEQRRSLAMQLATYADGDGTRVNAGVERYMREMGWPKRTLDRRLAELAELGVLKTVGRTKERGTARRVIDFSVLRVPGATKVPDTTATVPDSDDQECQIAPPKCQMAQPEMPNSTAKVPDTIGTQPPLNRHPTAHSGRAASGLAG